MQIIDDMAMRLYSCHVFLYLCVCVEGGGGVLDLDIHAADTLVNIE